MKDLHFQDVKCDIMSFYVFVIIAHFDFFFDAFSVYKWVLVLFQTDNFYIFFSVRVCVSFKSVGGNWLTDLFDPSLCSYEIKLKIFNGLLSKYSYIFYMNNTFRQWNKFYRSDRKIFLQDRVNLAWHIHYMYVHKKIVLCTFIVVIITTTSWQ